MCLESRSSPPYYSVFKLFVAETLNGSITTFSLVYLTPFPLHPNHLEKVGFSSLCKEKLCVCLDIWLIATSPDTWPQAPETPDLRYLPVLIGKIFFLGAFQK